MSFSIRNVCSYSRSTLFYPYRSSATSGKKFPKNTLSKSFIQRLELLGKDLNEISKSKAEMEGE